MFKGLDLDSQESITEGYKYAKNLKMTDGLFRNEEGNRLLFELNEEIKGEITTSEDLVIFTKNKIRWYKNDKLEHSITTDVEFGEIQGTFHYNYKNELIIAFTDGVNPIGYLNLNNARDNKLLDIKYIDMHLFRNKQLPLIEVVKNTTGFLEEGSYKFYIRYKEGDKTVTNFISSSEIIGVSNTFKSVDLKITNLDKGYQFIDLAVVKNINNIETASLITSIQISNEINYTYEGGQTEAILSLEDILVDYVSYPYANTIASHENYLAIGGLRTNDYNDQAIFKNILIDWLPNQEGNKTFVPNEVYAFYVRGIDYSGNRTRWFLIPHTNTPGNPKVINGQQLLLSSHFANQNERLTLKDFGTNDNVRHHLGWGEIQDSMKPTHAYFDLRNVNKELLKGRYQKLEYGIAKKNWKDRRSLGFDTLFFSGVADTRQVATAGGIAIDALNRGETKDLGLTSALGNLVLGNGFGGDLSWQIRPTSKYIRLHSPEMMIDKPNVPITTIVPWQTIVFRSQRINANERWWAGETLIGNIRERKFLTNTNGDNQFQLTTDTKNQSEQYYLKANDVALAQIKGSDIQINNRRSEPFRLAELENDKLYNLITRLAGSGNNINYGFPFLKASANTFDWYSLYVQLINEKEDYHKDFYNQEVVTLGVYDIDDTIVKGDAFIVDHSLSLYSPVASSSFENGEQDFPVFENNRAGTFKIDDKVGHKHHITYKTISLYDLSNRTQDLEDNTKFYPLSTRTFADDFDMLSNDIDTNINLKAGFRKYDVTTGLVHNPNSEYLNSFPFRVAGSVQQTSEEVTGNWRLFSALDYIEMPKTRGRIVNLSSMQEKLIIHTNNAFFITKGQDELESNNSNIYLSTIDLWKQKPLEVFYSLEGYAGIENKKNAKLTKIGYLWGNKGKLFSFQEQLKEISQNGMRKFFRDSGTSDITIAYDDFNERVIIASPKYTISYRNEVFVSFHDYVSERVFSVGNRLYSIFDNNIWKHDDKLFTVFYNKEFPCFIDIVFNKIINKNLSSVSWITNSQNEDGEFDYNDTFDIAHIRTENQCSGTVVLRNLENIRNAQGIWSWNDFRDILIKDRNIVTGVLEDFNIIQKNMDYNKLWFEKKRFNVNDWAIARLMYNKNQNSFIIKTIEPNTRLSAR